MGSSASSATAGSRTVRMKAIWPFTTTPKSAEEDMTSAIKRQELSPPRCCLSRSAEANGRRHRCCATTPAASHTCSISFNVLGEITDAKTCTCWSVRSSSTKSKGQSSPMVENCRIAWKRTISGNSSGGATGSCIWRISTAERGIAMSVSMPFASLTACLMASPITAGVTPSSSATACVSSMAIPCPRLRPTAIRNSAESHSIAIYFAIIYLFRCSRINTLVRFVLSN